MAFDVINNKNNEDGNDTECIAADVMSTAIEEHVNANVALLDDMIDRCIATPPNDGTGTGGEKGGDVLRYYDGLSHRRMFSLPKPLRENMKKDRRIMTKENPVFMY
jgi:hypothetical protein